MRLLIEAISDSDRVEEIVRYIDDLDEGDYIRVCNAYSPDNPIMTPDEFNASFRGWKALDVIRAAVTEDGEDFDPDARYFIDGGEYGWQCVDRFGDLKHADFTRDMASYAVSEDDDFGDKGIREILDRE